MYNTLGINFLIHAGGFQVTAGLLHVDISPTSYPSLKLVCKQLDLYSKLLMWGDIQSLKLREVKRCGLTAKGYL